MARGNTHYLDASALVKLVVAEDHAEKCRAYCGRALLATTVLCFGEALGVLKAKWTHGRLTQEAYLAACEELFARVRNNSLEIEDTPLLSGDSQELRANFERIEQLAQKHSLDISDALQLVTLQSGTYARLEGTARASLVTADRRLALAAKAGACPHGTVFMILHPNRRIDTDRFAVDHAERLGRTKPYVFFPTRGFSPP